MLQNRTPDVQFGYRPDYTPWLCIQPHAGAYRTCQQAAAALCELKKLQRCTKCCTSTPSEAASCWLSGPATFICMPVQDRCQLLHHAVATPLNAGTPAQQHPGTPIQDTGTIGKEVRGRGMCCMMCMSCDQSWHAAFKPRRVTAQQAPHQHNSSLQANSTAHKQQWHCPSQHTVKSGKHMSQTAATGCGCEPLMNTPDPQG